MYREDKPHGKRKREKDRMDPVKSHAPERGSAAMLKPGTGGNIGVTGGTLLTQYILKNQVRCFIRCQWCDSSTCSYPPVLYMISAACLQVV